MQPQQLSLPHDIQLPEQIGWWPLAWGWWLVITLVITLLILIAIALYQRHLQHKAKKSALKQLKTLAVENTPLATAKQINDILKRVVLAYTDRATVAELAGEKWATWLNNGSKTSRIEPELLSLAYQADCSAEQVRLYQNQSINWIKQNLPKLKGQQGGQTHV